MLLRGHAFVQAEDPEHGLVGGEFVVALLPDRRADASRQDAVLVGDGRNDARDELILQGEDLFRAKGAVEGLRPEVRPARGVDELHGQANRRTNLAKAALHHVARAELFVVGRGAPLGGR